VRAQNYTDRIIARLGLVTFPERGTRRDDLRPGLRITTWRRRVTIAFHITPTTVIIDRILRRYAESVGYPGLVADRDGLRGAGGGLFAGRVGAANSGLRCRWQPARKPPSTADGRVAQR
jgi:hypothetical protein